MAGAGAFLKWRACRNRTVMLPQEDMQWCHAPLQQQKTQQQQKIETTRVECKDEITLQQ
jgi:hypothetical protein